MSKRVIAILERKLRAAERRERVFSRAYSDGRGTPRYVAQQRDLALKEMAELTFAIDVLRRAYEQRVPALGQSV